MISDDLCPVSEKFLGRLYDSAERGIASDLPSSKRGELALFCYRPGAHFRRIVVAIAATCDLGIINGCWRQGW
jgi:hypothetical protein